MRYKSYFAHLSDDIEKYEEIGSLLGMGYTFDEIEKKLGIDAELIIQVLDDFVRGNIKTTIFESKMERYDEKRTN